MDGLVALNQPRNTTFFSYRITDHIHLGHPYEPLLAVSGIDHTIKIFSPDLQAQAAARHGINLGTSFAQSPGRSSLRTWPRLRQTRAPSDDIEAITVDNETLSPDTLSPGAVDENESDALGHPRNGGLASRKRMHDSYRIVSQNDVERQGGLRDAYITVRGPLLPLRMLALDFGVWLEMMRQ